MDVKPAHFSSDTEDMAAAEGGLIDSRFVSRPVFQLLVSDRSPYN